jgi:5-methylcytosine-specific restriction endonuclease McrA
MNGHVLVLNQDYQPLSVCGVKKSLMLLCLEKAELLHPLIDRKIRTVNMEYDFPSVIRLRRYARIPFKTIVLTRKNVMKRDGNRCQYCGTHEDLTIDHVIPRSRGGLDTWENLVAACNRCNHKKGNHTPKEAGMPLRREPFRPHHILFLQEFVGTVDDHWRPYLYMG